MKYSSFFAISALLLSGCSFSNEPAPLDSESAKLHTQAAASWTLSKNPTWTGEVLFGSGFPSRAVKSFPIPKAYEWEVRSVLLTPLSKCFDKEFPNTVRNLFSKLDAPDVVKNRTDETIVDRCQIRANLREEKDCSSLPSDLQSDCKNLRVSLTVLADKKAVERRSSESSAARSIYQTYFIDLDKFPPKDFAEFVAPKKP